MGLSQVVQQRGLHVIWGVADDILPFFLLGLFIGACHRESRHSLWLGARLAVLPTDLLVGALGCLRLLVPNHKKKSGWV